MPKTLILKALCLCVSACTLLCLDQASWAAKHFKGDYKPSVKALSYKNAAVTVPTCPPPLSLAQGPYFGLSAGYDSYKIHEQINLFGTSTTVSNNPTTNATGLIGGLLAGYGQFFNSTLYLGGEVFLNISEAYQTSNLATSDSVSGDAITDNSKFFATTGYGVSILPGVKLNDGGMVFVRLGYNVTRLRGQENITLEGNPVLSNSSSWSGGFSYGVGFEEAMVESFSLRGEYIHIDFRTFSATSGTEYSASNNRFQVSLIYHL